ncbi:MAG: hypothetical protein QOE33_11 [Acidobacteriota bacterium]|nr:hypothetical protein [Acidobacteriota bacterium]
MENVERTHFVVLTGHLDERPLPDLMRTLRAQRKSGRLQVEYPDSPGSFFFEEGQLVDAQLGSLRGVEALYAALSLRGAAFNFNPLVRPPERSIDRQGQKFVQDLIEVPRREGLSEIRLAGSDARNVGAAVAPALQPAVPALTPAPQNALVRLEPNAAAQLTAPLEARLTAVEAAIAHTSRRFSRERMIYAVVISFLVGLTAITALQAIIDLHRRANADATQNAQTIAKPEVTGPTNNVANATTGATGVNDTTDTSATGAANTSSTVKQETAKQDQIAKQDQRTGAVGPARDSSSQIARASKKSERAARQSQPGVVASSRDGRSASDRSAASSGGYVVHVLMEVKNGQVTEARVLNPRAGADAYEALALRMARQRRYPDNFTGGDTWKIKVRP